MELDISRIISQDVLTLTKNLCDEKLYFARKQDFEYMVGNINLFVRYRSNVVEFAIASLTFPTWCTYSCLITAADALRLRAGDLANRFVLTPERNEPQAFATYAKETSGLGTGQISAQVDFLAQAIRFVNTVSDLKCYEHCDRQCQKEYPNDRQAYRKCLGSCIENVRC